MFKFWKGKQRARTTIIDHLRQDRTANSESIISRIKGGEMDVAITDKSGRTILHWATILEKRDLVVYLLDHQTVELKAKDRLGKPALYYAILLENGDMVRKLLQAYGEDWTINYDKNGGSAIYDAVGRRDSVRRVFLVPNLIMLQDRAGRTPLHYAARIGDLEAVSSLLRDEAEVDFKDNKGKTALHQAACLGCVKTMETLIDHGADVEAEDHDGNTSLHDAAASGNFAAFMLLRSDPKSPPEKMREKMKLLAESISDINAVDSEGRTLLHWAVEERDFDLFYAVMKRLREKKGPTDNKARSPNIQDNNGKTPMDLAADSCNYQTIDSDPNYAIDPSDTSNYFRRPACTSRYSYYTYDSSSNYTDLRSDCSGSYQSDNGDKSNEGGEETDVKAPKIRTITQSETDHKENSDDEESRESTLKDILYLIRSMLLYLLENHDSSDQHSTHQDGRTLLHVAAQFGDSSLEEPMQKYLKQAGVARTDETDSRGNTPLHLAVKSKNLYMVETILWHLGIRKTMSRVGTSLTKKDVFHGETPVHQAMRLADKAIARVILVHLDQMEESAALGIPDNSGVTPLHYLVGFASEADMGLLFKLLSKTDKELLALEDAHLNTPLNWAMRWNPQPSAVKMILQRLKHTRYGASLVMQNRVGDTPLHIAAMQQEDGGEVVELILDCLDQIGQSQAMVIPNIVGNTPLHIAAASSYRAVELILQQLEQTGQGEEAMLRNGEGDTPLHIAAANSHRAVELILQHLDKTGQGEAVVLQNNEGDTPLHMAAARDKAERRVEILLQSLETAQHSSSVAMQNRSGNTPLHVALERWFVELKVVEVILQHLRQTNQSAAATVKNEDGNTSLHLATRHRDRPEVMEMVLQHLDKTELSEAMTAPNNLGDTPLHKSIRETVRRWGRRTVNKGLEVMLRYLARTSGDAFKMKNSDGKMPIEMTQSRTIKDLIQKAMSTSEIASYGIPACLVPLPETLAESASGSVWGTNRCTAGGANRDYVTAHRWRCT